MVVDRASGFSNDVFIDIIVDNVVVHHASATTTVDQFPPQDGWLDDCRFVLGPRYFSNESYAAGNRQPS